MSPGRVFYLKSVSPAECKHTRRSRRIHLSQPFNQISLYDSVSSFPADIFHFNYKYRQSFSKKTWTTEEWKLVKTQTTYCHILLCYCWDVFSLVEPPQGLWLDCLLSASVGVQTEASPALEQNKCLYWKEFVALGPGEMIKYKSSSGNRLQQLFLFFFDRHEEKQKQEYFRSNSERGSVRLVYDCLSRCRDDAHGYFLSNTF